MHSAGTEAHCQAIFQAEGRAVHSRGWERSFWGADQLLLLDLNDSQIFIL